MWFFLILSANIHVSVLNQQIANMKDNQLAYQKKLLGPNVTYKVKNKR